jgi:hypothetical protein
MAIIAANNAFVLSSMRYSVKVGLEFQRGELIHGVELLQEQRERHVIFRCDSVVNAVDIPMVLVTARPGNLRGEIFKCFVVMNRVDVSQNLSPTPASDNILGSSDMVPLKMMCRSADYGGNCTHQADRR